MTSDRVTLGIGIALVVVAILAVVGVAVWPGSAGSRIDSVVADVEALRKAELDHLEAFGRPLSAAAAPRPLLAVTADPVRWTPSEGFRALAWAPADRNQVYASFAVSVDGDDFVVTARCDLDGDGVLAEVEARRDTPAQRLTPPAVR